MDINGELLCVVDQTNSNLFSISSWRSSLLAGFWILGAHIICAQTRSVFTHMRKSMVLKL